MRVAAIDCGTNSIRLLIADVDGGGLTDVVRVMKVVRLGEGVDVSGSLSPAAIERTWDAVSDYAAQIRAAGAQAVRMVATSASRDADNADVFVDGVLARLGEVPEVISGEEEAQLSFLGATAELDPLDGPFLVVDIGGGSTEFAVGRSDDAGGIRFDGGVSIDVGCVRMTERYLVSDPPDAAELSSCLSVLQLHWDDVRAALPAAFDAARLVGLAGTVVNMAAVEIGLAAYDRSATHHFVLTKDAAEDVFRTLATETVEDRKHNPGLDVGRADVIVGGACILVSIMRNFGFDECLVSESDILDGLILSQRS